MLLQRLREYSERPDIVAKLPAPGYDFVNVRHVLDLRSDGRAPSLTTLGDDTPRGKRGIRKAMPQTATKTSGIVALPFFGNGQYVFGIRRATSKQERAEDEHRAFLSLVDEYATLKHPAVSAVQAFYQNGGPGLLDLPEQFKPDDPVGMRFDNQFLTDLPEVQRRWHDRNEATDAPVMQCIACGLVRRVSRILEGKVKGIPGGQTAGTALISANSEAFESYGLRSSLVAPTCGECATRFTQALNHLLADEYSRIRFADSVYVWWTREPEEHNIFRLLDEAAPQDVKTFMESVQSGRRARPADPNRFYAVALSAAGGRAVVREWIDTTLPEAEDALAHWFDQQAIVDMADGDRRYFSLRSLAGATVRDLRDVSPPTTRTLLRSALTGTPLPADMLAATVRRTVAERRVTGPQAALIKAALTSRRGDTEKENPMVELDTAQSSPGYQCGRLLAVLESVQRAALPGVKAGIVDRYFGSASSSPASVFPRLVRGAQPHLGRLERDRPAAQVALQRRLEEILQGLQTFPRVLSLQEQGLFALGYYHQRADDRIRARAASERRRAGTASAADEGDAALDEEETP